MFKVRDDRMKREVKDISIRKAAVINAASKYLTVILQLVYTAILSRILTPEDYGTVAVINVFIVFFQLIADMGFGTAVIQDKGLTDQDIDSIYSFNVYLGIVLILMFQLFSHAIAAVYNDEIYSRLGIILAAALGFYSWNAIPNAVMLKSKKFIAIAVRTIVVSAFSFTCTIIFALRGAGVYALALNTLFGAAGLFFWNEVSVRLKFLFRPSMIPIKKIIMYSFYQFAAQTLNYFNRNLDNLLIGKFMSKDKLGYYSKAYSMQQMPVSYLPGVITPVLHPILSEHQDDREYIFSNYLKLLKFLSLLGAFGSAYCWFAGKEIIRIAFGRQWDESIKPFMILSLSLWPQILTNTIAPIYQSIGNTKLMFKNLIFTTAMIVSFIVGGIMSGDIGTVSICVSIAYGLNFFITFFVLSKFGFHTSYLKFLINFKEDMLIYIVLLVFSILFPITFENLIFGFAAKFVILFLLFLVMLIATKQTKWVTNIFGKGKRRNHG